MYVELSKAIENKLKNAAILRQPETCIALTDEDIGNIKVIIKELKRRKYTVRYLKLDAYLRVTF